MTVSTMQLGVCALYALILWVIGLNPVKLCGLQAPDKQALPKSTKDDIIKTVPVGFCAAAAHSSSVFALGGDPLFGQIVKAGEPVMSAIVNTLFYGKPPFVVFISPAAISYRSDIDKTNLDVCGESRRAHTQHDGSGC